MFASKRVDDMFSALSRQNPQFTYYNEYYEDADIYENVSYLNERVFQLIGYTSAEVLAQPGFWVSGHLQVCS
jgi:hypothetical protein